MSPTKPLIQRISEAMKHVDQQCSDLSQNMPLLPEARGYERMLTSLYAELAQEVKNAKRTQLSKYVARRLEQAERFMHDRKDLGMTSKDAEEDSKVFMKDGDFIEDEIEADANWEYMMTLKHALNLKIQFAQNVANDAKLFFRLENPSA